MEASFMDINNSLSSRLKVNKSITASGNQKSIDASRTRSTSYPEQNKISEQNKMPDLKEGQIIKGEIIDHRFNEVKIKLESGEQVITARLSDEISLPIGQKASFIVSDLNSETIVLKLSVPETSANDSIVAKALTAAGITINERSKAIVNELLNQRMPVDKQTLQTLIRLSNMHRAASPLCLVLMHKNHIPINSKSIQQFQAYLDGTHQLLYKIKDITQNMSRLINVSIHPEYESNPSQSMPLYSDSTLAQSENKMLSDNNMSLDNKLLSDKLNSINNTDTETVFNTFEAKAVNMDILGQAKSPEIDTLPNAVAINNKLIDICLNNTEPASQDEANVIINGEQTQAIFQIELTDIMDNYDMEALLKVLSDEVDSNSLKEKIASKTATIGETLSYIKKALESSDKIQISKLLGSEEYTKLLEKAFFKKWTIAPEDSADKDSVENFYKQLEADINKIHKLASSLAETDESAQVQKPLDSLQDNLQFMKDLNNTFAYLQLPLDFKDRQLHADLYVLNRRRGKADKSESLNVHLYLETANLGSLNIQLKMTNKQIEAVFYPESDDVALIIKENLPLLTSSLQEKGYIFMADVDQSKQEDNIFKKLMEQNNQDSSTLRYTFDIRT